MSEASDTVIPQKQTQATRRVATATVLDDPGVILTYGASGLGKTTDQGYSFPNALFAAAPGALKSIRAVCGYEPRREDVGNIEDATKTIETAATTPGVDAVVVDDFSFVMDRTIVDLERRYTGFKLWGRLRELVLAFRAAARYSKIHVILNCWEQPPKTTPAGAYVRGGPRLTGDLPEQLPAMCDLVLRARFDATRKPWGGIYVCGGSSEWVGKDRDDGTPSPAPMNLGEIMRLNGYTLSRHRDVAGWQEAAVEAVASQLVASSEAQEIAIVEDSYSTLLGQGIPAHFARWTLRDARDRAALRRARAAKLATFF